MSDTVPRTENSQGALTLFAPNRLRQIEGQSIRTGLITALPQTVSNMIRVLAFPLAFGFLTSCSANGDLLFSFDWQNGFQEKPVATSLRPRGAGPAEVEETDAYAQLRARVESGELTQAEAVAELRRLEAIGALETADTVAPTLAAAPAPTRETDETQQSDTTRRTIGATRVRASAGSSVTCEDGSTVERIELCATASGPGQ